MYMSESSLHALVDAAFEYALRSYWITAEQYPQVTGVSLENTKAVIKSEIDMSDFSEEGCYRVENGVLYMLVEGNPEKVQNYTFEDGKLILYEGGTNLILSREIAE